MPGKIITEYYETDALSELEKALIAATHILDNVRAYNKAAIEADGFDLPLADESASESVHAQVLAAWTKLKARAVVTL